jgi:hypothetical protein
MMMYHEPIDISDRMIRVPRDFESLRSIVIERTGQASLAELAAYQWTCRRDSTDLIRPRIAGAQLLAGARAIVVFLKMLPDQVGAKIVARLPLQCQRAGKPLLFLTRLHGTRQAGKKDTSAGPA